MASITELRTILLSLNQRALACREILESLSKKRFWLNREKTINSAANAIFGNSGYDACERYASVEEFASELAEDLDKSYTRDSKEGQYCYVFRPFAEGGRPENSQDLGFGYLCMLADGHTALLRNAQSFMAGPKEPEGLSEQEMAWLSDVLKARSLELLNGFREAETAVRYVFSARSNKSATCLSLSLVAEDEGIDVLLADFGKLVALQGLPPVARFFGSDADKVNRLTELPANLSAILEPEISKA